MRQFDNQRSLFYCVTLKLLPF